MKNKKAIKCANTQSPIRKANTKGKKFSIHLTIQIYEN